MGLFKRFKKFALKVGRSGLSAATGGQSERVIQAAKALGKYIHPLKANKLAVPASLTPPHVRDIITKFGKGGRQRLSAGVLTIKRRKKDINAMTDRMDSKAVPGIPYKGKKRMTSRQKDIMNRDADDLTPAEESWAKKRGKGKGQQFKKAPSPAQLAARAKFAAMVKARAAARKAG